MNDMLVNFYTTQAILINEMCFILQDRISLNFSYSFLCITMYIDQTGSSGKSKLKMKQTSGTVQKLRRSQLRILYARSKYTQFLLCSVLWRQISNWLVMLQAICNILSRRWTWKCAITFRRILNARLLGKVTDLYRILKKNISFLVLSSVIVVCRVPCVCKKNCITKNSDIYVCLLNK